MTAGALAIVIKLFCDTYTIKPTMQNDKADRKILLVDDDADDCKYFMEAVNEIDPSIEVVTAKDGRQALTILEACDGALPDYIFLDLRMPRVNGKQFLQLIKDNGSLKNIPVVIYTTSTEVQESEEMQGLGAVHFVSKPSDPEEIYYVLSMVLDGKWDKDSWQNHKL